MRHFLLISATSLLLAAPSLSYAACTITDEKTEQELSKVEGISSGDFGEVRRDVRSLRSAATILQRYGKDVACQQVVSTMSDLLRNPKASLDMRKKSMVSSQTGALQEQPSQDSPSTGGQAAADTQQQPAADSQTSASTQPTGDSQTSASIQQPAKDNQTSASTQQPATDSQTSASTQQPASTEQQTTANNQAASTEQPAAPATDKSDPQITGSTTPATSTDPGSMTMDQRRTSSVPFAEQKNPMSAADLIGADVYGKDNDSIGEIEDVIVSPDNKPSYALVSYGGFLGLGENQAAVPIAALRVSPDKYVFIPVTSEQLRAAPQLERGTADWWTNENFRTQNDEYYAQLK